MLELIEFQIREIVQRKFCLMQILLTPVHLFASQNIALFTCILDLSWLPPDF